MEEKVFNKLVRDRIPEIIEGNGEIAVTRILDEDEYKLELEKKLLEECNEVLKAVSHDERIEEFADVLEVLCALSTLEDADLEKIILVMNNKREKRGGFSQKIFLEKTMK